MKAALRTAAYCAVALLIFLCGLFLGRARERADAAMTRAAREGSLSSEDSLPFSSLLPLIPGTKPEMLSPDFWIREPDRLLFSAEEIEDFSRNNPPYVSYSDVLDGEEHFLFIYDMPESVSGEAVRRLMQHADPEKLSASFPCVNGSIASPDYWEELSARRGIERIPDQVQPRYALCVSRCLAMQLPTEDFAAADAGERYCNELISAELLPCTGAVILHESTDGQWVYAICGSFCGWVRQEHLALCPDRESWLETLRPASFLVVTGSEIVLEQTVEPSASAGMILPMGTKLPLLEPRPEEIDGRSGLGCWAVGIPVRAGDGTLAWEQALIPVSKDVHEGWLTMTSSSVIRQAFKFLGRIYGWGGSLDANDCSGMIRQIYGCYGFELPRNARAIARLQDLGCGIFAKMAADKKLELLAQMPPGQLLYMDGHLMLYLGMDGGKPYVLSSCATYREPEGGSPEILGSYCVFVSGLDLRRANGRTWLEELVYFQWTDY